MNMRHGPVQWEQFFPVDGFSLADGRALEWLFSLVIPKQRVLDWRTRELRIVRADFALHLDFDRSVTIPLPPARSRAGKPLRFVDVSGKCSPQNQIVLEPRREEPILNHSGPVVMDRPGQVVTLWPFFDGDGRRDGWWLDHADLFAAAPPGPLPPVIPPVPPSVLPPIPIPPLFDGAQVALTPGGDLLVRVNGVWVQPDPGYRLEQDGTLLVQIGNALVQVPGTGAPVSSTNAPTNPVVGQFWEDTSTTPAVLKIWDGSTWQVIGAGGGGGGGGSATAPQTASVLGATNYQALAGDDVIFWSGAPGSTITLPAVADTADGHVIRIILAGAAGSILEPNGTDNWNVQAIEADGTNSTGHGGPLTLVSAPGSSGNLLGELVCVKIESLWWVYNGGTPINATQSGINFTIPGKTAGGDIGVFAATANGLVPAPANQTTFLESVLRNGALATEAVPPNLYPFFSVNADTVWRPKTGSFQFVASGNLQIDPDAGLVVADNQSGAPISLGLPALADVQPGWIIRVGIPHADPVGTVTIAAASGDDIRFQGSSVNPAVLTSPRLVQVVAASATAGPFWSFTNFGPPTALFAGLAPAANGAAGTFLNSNYEWDTPGGGGGSPVMPNIPQNTVLGSVTAGSTQPAALAQQQLQSIIGVFTTALSGLVAAPGVGTPGNWVLRPNDTFAPYAPAQKYISSSNFFFGSSQPYAVTATDEIINIDTSTGQTGAILLPLASTRNGLPLEIKQVTGGSTSAGFVIGLTASDTLDGNPGSAPTPQTAQYGNIVWRSSDVAGNNPTTYAYLRLVPANDGTSTGWFIH